MINSNYDTEEKIYFTPGNIVQMKQDIPNKPLMVVTKIERFIIKNDSSNPPLKGVKCRWFTVDGYIQEAVFSTKDLILIK